MNIYEITYRLRGSKMNPEKHILIAAVKGAHARAKFNEEFGEKDYIIIKVDCIYSVN